MWTFSRMTRLLPAWSPDAPEEREWLLRGYKASGMLDYEADSSCRYRTRCSYEEKMAIRDRVVMGGRRPADGGNIFLGFEIPFAGPVPPFLPP